MLDFIEIHRNEHSRVFLCFFHMEYAVHIFIYFFTVDSNSKLLGSNENVIQDGSNEILKYFGFEVGFVALQWKQGPEIQKKKKKTNIKLI